MVRWGLLPSSAHNWTAEPLASPGWALTAAFCILMSRRPAAVGFSEPPSAFYNEQSKHKVIFYAKLVTADHQPIVTLQPYEALKHLTHLVNRTHVPSWQPRMPVTDERKLWP